MADITAINKFISRIPEFYKLADKTQVTYAAYYLTEVDASPFTAHELEVLFTQELKRKAPRISPFLAEESGKRGGKGQFVKTKTRGYELSGATHAEIKKSLEKIPELKQFDDDLVALINSVADNTERKLLDEAVRCYQVGSNRAMVILTWLVTLYHLENYTITKHLVDFNMAVSRHPDRRVNILSIQRIDDFTDLKESSLIELFRSAGIISNSVRKILDSRLNERNTAAHPSSVAISSPQAISFAHDLVSNVILKY